MARAEPLTKERQPLYERDFYLWVEEQVRLLRQGNFERLDVANLVEEVEDLRIGAKKAVKSNLVVVLLHLLNTSFNRSDALAAGSTRSSSIGSGCATI